MNVKRAKKGSAAPAALLLAGTLALAGVLALTVAAFAADLLTVVQRETAIRKDKRLLSAKVATVKEGDQVVKLAADGSWFQVEFEGSQGWLPSSAVSSDQKVVLSGQAAASGVRATEQSAGARGFNPQVEARHRSSRADLAAAYRKVDQIQERKLSEEKIAQFIREGKLGDSVAQAMPLDAKGREARLTPPWKR